MGNIRAPYFQKYVGENSRNKFLLDLPKDSDEYYLSFAESIYSAYLNDTTSVRYSSYYYLSDLRAYGRGNQNENKYKEFLYDNDTFSDKKVERDSLRNVFSNQDALREGFNSLIWDVLSYATKIRNTIHGTVDGVDFDVFCDCVDWKSKDEKQRRKWQDWNNKENLEFMNQFKSNAGIPIDEPTYVPSSLQELNDYEATGNYRLNEARVIEKVLKNHWKSSRWDEYLKRKITGDLIDFNFAVSKTYYDPIEKIFKDKYIDPLNFVCQYSDTWEYDDSSFWGHFETRNIMDLEALGFSRAELIKIAHNYDNIHGNESYSSGRWNNLIKGNSDEVFWMDFKVSVFNAEWIDTESKKLSTYIDGRGVSTTMNVDINYEARPIPKRKQRKGVINEIETYKKQRLYKATWIVGTEHVYDKGLVNFTDRPNNTTVRSSYSPIQTEGVSLTSQLKPIYDMFMISWLKFQDNIAKAFDSGYQVNVHMLENIYDGKNQLGIKEILDMYRKNKLLLYKYSPQGNYGGGASVPMSPIQSTINEDIGIHLNNMNAMLKMMEDVTGLNPVSLGGSAQGEAVANTELAVEAASKVLTPLYKAVFRIKGLSAESICRRVPLALRFSDEIYKAYSKILSESDMKLLKDGAINDIVYSFDFKEKPKQEQIQRIVGYIQAALDLGRNGAKGGVEADVAMRLESMLQRGSNLEEVRLMLSYEIVKYNERLQRDKSAGIQEQSRANQEDIATKAQLDEQGKQADHGRKLEEIQVDGEMKMKLARIKASADAMNSFISNTSQMEIAQNQGGQNA